MKRLLLIMACLCGLAIPQTTVNSAATPTTIAASQNGWEYIGKISLHRISNYDSGLRKYSVRHVHYGYLYAKAIGPKLFYQVKYDTQSQGYSVESCYVYAYCYDCHNDIILDGKAGDYYVSLP